MRRYFAGDPRFDTTLADQLLAPLGVRPPPVAETFEPLLRYAVSSDLGRAEAG